MKEKHRLESGSLGHSGLPSPFPIRYTHFKGDRHTNGVPSSDHQRVPCAGVHKELGTDWNTQNGLSPPSTLGTQPQVSNKAELEGDTWARLIDAEIHGGGQGGALKEM